MSKLFIKVFSKHSVYIISIVILLTRVTKLVNVEMEFFVTISSSESKEDLKERELSITLKAGPQSQTEVRKETIGFDVN